jgi:endoribonuclease L-PSP
MQCPIPAGPGHLGTDVRHGPRSGIYKWGGTIGRREARLEKGSRRVPEDSAATPAEITAAMEALSTPALLRLRNYARLRVQILGRKAAGRTDTELLADAMNATLEGKRRWNKRKVDFVGHLIGAMRSISSHWRTQSKSPDEAVNAIYSRYFPKHPPARIFVNVPAWPGHFDIEIDCIAAVG